jgi:hypothetical protein
MTTPWQRISCVALALLGCAVLSGGAAAQTCTPPATTNGPDVIVGDLTGPSNYSSSGGIEALSLGTYSCNIGDVWLNWISSTNQHPVIGQNLFRYRVDANGAARFEQVGQSWLKHGFFALSNTLCCSGCQSTDGSHLGVKCSDPYTSARNGSQSGLGPKWQVNAYTGNFTYPPANPAWSGSVARRLQVAITDLEATNGSTIRYFGSGQYVTPDDAAAGNQNNNESWREITVTGSGSAWTFGLAGSTVRGMYALNAWKTVDSTVTLREVQIPGDGLLIVGYKTYPLGGGLYRYEYAVQNLNADRSIGSFSIPAAAGLSITNIGFHGVVYRDGDGPGNVNYDGTDWPGTYAGGAVSWATTPFGTNPNANAIRWGTTYNFRFDANAAPVAGTATLGYFKVAGSITANVDVPGGGGPASFAYCFGDGSGTACPCGNNSAVGANAGCLNSLGSGGTLSQAGSASVSADTLVLTGAGMPDSSALYFQGTAQSNGGLGTVFGDGLRCAGGTVIRLGTKANSLGTSQYPSGGDQPISVRGADAAGDVRTYQVWYRNAAAFCNPETFNLTSAWQIVWQP